MLVPGENYFYLLTLLPLLGYAETHYRFTGLPSLIYQRQPEIIADLPRRLQPGENLPIVILIKDADRFPVEIHSITARIKQGKTKEIIELSNKSFPISDYLFHTFYFINNDRLPTGEFEIDINMKYSVNGRPKQAHNDNHRGTSHKPFKVNNSLQQWPANEGWFSGDIHNHSDVTDDFVEFGAPVEVYQKMATVLGLDWLAITDHSYDIDDEPGKYYAPDPELKRWKMLAQRIDELNRAGDCILIRGEEISCGSKDNRNVHLLGLDIEKFIPGFGDSAESWFHNSPNQPASRVIENILQQGGLPIAAHPGEKPKYLEKLLLNRGPWRYEDLIDDNLIHLQVFNGRRTDSFFDGVNLWVEMLLEGRRKIVVAGSDAHGNFNRLRQISIPFLSIRESNRQVFGCSRTLVYLGNKTPSQQSILEAIYRGNCIITDGPFIDLYFINHDTTRRIPGDNIENFDSTEWLLNAEIKTSDEFGSFKRFVMYYGYNGAPGEKIVFEKNSFGNNQQNSFRNINIKDIITGKQTDYIRAELTTENDNICLTNPIWVSR